MEKITIYLRGLSKTLKRVDRKYLKLKFNYEKKFSDLLTLLIVCFLSFKSDLQADSVFCNDDTGCCTFSFAGLVHPEIGGCYNEGQQCTGQIDITIGGCDNQVAP